MSERKRIRWVDIPCPLCGDHEAEIHGPDGWPLPLYLATCACYDGAPDAGYQPVGFAGTIEEALAALADDRTFAAEEPGALQDPPPCAKLSTP